jgi:hypothetical protein
MRFRPGFRYGASTAVMGALALLAGETDGFAIDATSYDGVTAAAYTGGPVGGTVAVINTGDPTDDLSNVALDSSNLVQSGTSPKMVHHLSSPYVRWSPHNYVLQSQTAGTTWTAQDTTVTDNDATAPDGTTTADALTHTNPTAYIQQNLGSQTGVVYTLSWYVKASGATWVRLMLTDFAANDFAVWFDVVNGTVGGNAVVGAGVVVSSAITSVGSDWYLCRITGHLGGSTGQFRPLIGFVTADSGAAAFTASKGGWIWGAQVNRGYTALPYLVTTTAARIGIPQSYDAAAAQYGILVEPAATNLVEYSEDFTQANWSGSASTSANTTVAPDGSTTADTFTFGAGSTSETANTTSYTSGTAYTMSVWAKVAAGTKAFRLKFWDSSVDNISGDLTATTDWQRFSYTATSSASGAGNASIMNGSGGGAADIIIWGYQAEAGTVATSYIPTLGSAVTRAVDKITAAFATFPISLTTLSVYADFKPAGLNAGATTYVCEVAQGIGDRHAIYANSGSPFVFSETNSVGQVNIDIGSVSEGTRYQISGAWEANNFAGSLDGAAATADTSGTMPADEGTDLLSLGGSSVASPWTEVGVYWIYRLVYVPRRVTDGDLATWRYNF